MTSSKSFLLRKRTGFLGLLLLLAAFAAGSVLPATPARKGRKASAPPKTVLGAVGVSGLQRWKPEAFLAATGLQAGMAFTAEDLDRITARLSASGMFRSLAWNAKTVKKKSVVQFNAVEKTNLLPACFDNFPWFEDEAIASRIRTSFPLYDGLVDEEGILAGTVRNNLDAMLKERNLPGKATSMLAAGFSSGQRCLRFAVSGGGAVCSELRLEGVSPALADDARKACEAIRGRDYSRSGTEAFVQHALLPVFQRRGRFQAACGPGRAEVLQVEGGRTSVRVTLPVKEGPEYHVGGLVWQGTGPIPQARLEVLLGFETGGAWNQDRFEEGLRRVQEEYARKAFFAAKAHFVLGRDDSLCTVRVMIQLDDGGVFRMGKVLFPGLSPSDTARLQREWKLRPGEAFDPDYPAEFVRSQGGKIAQAWQAGQTRKNGSVSVRQEVRPDPASKTVDVVITLSP